MLDHLIVQFLVVLSALPYPVFALPADNLFLEAINQRARNNG